MSNLENVFPGLRDTRHAETSPKDKSYNCIAWAAGNSEVWWEPDLRRQYYWPRDALRAYSIDAYFAAYATLGYETCHSAEYEEGYDKAALFVDEIGFPTHAARQLPSGRWTSKLGRSEDIEHELHALEGEKYGRVALLLRRPSQHDSE